MELVRDSISNYMLRIFHQNSLTPASDDLHICRCRGLQASAVPYIPAGSDAQQQLFLLIAECYIGSKVLLQDERNRKVKHSWLLMSRLHD